LREYQRFGELRQTSSDPEERMDRRQFLIGATSAFALQARLRAAQGSLPVKGKDSANQKFADVLGRFQEDPDLATSSKRAEERGFEPLKPGPERAGARGKKSKREISEGATKLIIAAEITNKRTYESKYSSPVWPGLMSGVTIGIGYDIGWVSQSDLAQDWKSYIDDKTIEILSRASGRRGSAAAELLDALKAIKIQWNSASDEFYSETLPRCIGATESALPNTSVLSNDCFGALVSIAYNRGPAFGEAGDRYREMRAIHDYMNQKHFQQIPVVIRRMKRLWLNDPKARGVVLRREAEALLFESGLEN
jgi:hypothetical protein